MTILKQDLTKYVNVLYYRGGFSKLIVHHYTSLDAVESILNSQLLYATDINYLNDKSELRGALDYIANASQRRTPKSAILLRFSSWLRDRVFRHSFFIGCFSTKASLLSQWRAYCQPGRGVSLGLPFIYLRDLCKKNDFRLGKCRYEPEEHAEMAQAILDALLEKESQDPQSDYAPYFEEIEDQVLQVAMLMKNPSFKEENEWRVITRMDPMASRDKVSLRVGRTTLIPYTPFGIAPPAPWKNMQLRMTLGPTPNEELSQRAARLLMLKYGLTANVDLCGIPYRDSV